MNIQEFKDSLSAYVQTLSEDIKAVEMSVINKLADYVDHKNKIDEAISFLQSEGYSITKI